MSQSKKLFVAATLLAVGYAAATMLGAPTPRLLSGTPRSVAPLPRDLSTATQGGGNPVAGRKLVGSVRLLPDTRATVVDKRRDSSSPAAMTPEVPAPDALTAPTVPSVPPAAFVTEPSFPLMSQPAPRASLKNESPRPLTDPAPVQIFPRILDTKVLNTWDQKTATVDTAPASAPNKSTTRNVWPAGFAASAAAPAPAVQAPAFDSPSAVSMPDARSSPVSPPPWPMPESEPARTHVVVDGDSLAKLAGRYLDDPRRSEEIYLLNQSVLSDPELLPIDVELKIPRRDRSDEFGGALSQSRMYGSPSAHAAVHTGLVPVQPLPTTRGTIPRAQLLTPMAVD